MASSGPLYAGTCANDSSYSPSSNPWINPTNATADDGSISYNGLLTNSYSDYLKWTNFGFGLSADATIDGIVVEFNRWSPTGYAVYDNRIRIVKGGTVSSTDRSAGAYWSGMSDGTYYSYGSSSDLWGETWTYSDINASNFGVVLSTDTRAFAAPYVDAARITVYYTVVSGQPSRKRFGGVTFGANGPQYGSGRMQWRHRQGLWLPERRLLKRVHPETQPSLAS